MAEPRRPNIVFVLTDDHAAHSIGCHGSVVNETPRIDEIAEHGCRSQGCEDVEVSDMARLPRCRWLNPGAMTG
jgi:hypothetical protein